MRGLEKSSRAAGVCVWGGGGGFFFNKFSFF